MAAKWRVAVIGRTGKGNYGHGLDVVWNACEDVEVVAVADPDEAGRAKAMARTKAKAGYADYREMLAKERPQIVSVADRFLGQHAEMVVACAEAGANVFLEKPMARSLAEADAMIDACQRSHVKLAIAHQTRMSPRIKVIRDLIGSGKIGDLVEIRARGKEDHRGGGEDLMVLGTHIFDLMRALAGDARWCFADVKQGGKPATLADVRPGGEEIGPILGDAIHATYGFDRGVIGTFGTRVRNGPGGRFGLTLYGAKGMIGVEFGSLPPAFLCEDPSWKGHSGWKPITSAGVDQPETIKGGAGTDYGNLLIVRDLIEAIEQDRPPASDMLDGRAALEMILAVYASHLKRAPVDLPLAERGHPLAGKTA